MKKLSIILIVLFTAVGASAQILPDSTVQICSNWAVGEQYTTEEVHLATGWPLNLYINKYIKAGTSAEETEETIERRSMEIILPDGNE